jgi:MoaA/NifB/PqqE/SkfB family radical SAM enzyme
LRSIDSMELSNLAFILTDRCNFDCAYCYESKGPWRLDPRTLVRAIELFRPYFARDCTISFYGGEPLLAFDLIQKAVAHIRALPAREGSTIRFSLTTNGSLLSDDILGFLSRHRFLISLSFDGLAQDISRKPGSYGLLVSLIPRILADERITLETNSVFSAETIGHLSGSVDLLVRLGVPEVDINFAHKPAWDTAALGRLEEEIGLAADLLAARFDDPRQVPWGYLRADAKRAVRMCPAGVDRMAVSAQGTLWGCAVLPHFRRDRYGPSGCAAYCFGSVEMFAEDPRRTYGGKIAAYSDLRMTRFSTPERSCLMCDDVEVCWVCPVAAGLAGGEIGRIDPASCRAAKILREARRRFLDRYDARRP